MNERTENPIRTDRDVTAEFNRAANPTDAPPSAPRAKHELTPPGPAGPSLGGPSPGGAPQIKNVSPQLREQQPEPSKPLVPLVRKAFTRAAVQGVFSEIFNRRANEREKDNGLER